PTRSFAGQVRGRSDELHRSPLCRERALRRRNRRRIHARAAPRGARELVQGARRRLDRRRRPPGAEAMNLLCLLFAVTAQAAPVTGLDADLEAWTGDFDGMMERRMIRVLVPYSRSLYFNDKGAQRGLVADSLKEFEIFLNKKYKLKNRPITIVAL